MPITNIRFAVLAHTNVQCTKWHFWPDLLISTMYYIQSTARCIDSKPKIGGTPASADISRLSMCQSIAQQGWKGQTKSHGSVQTSFEITNCKKRTIREPRSTSPVDSQPSERAHHGSGWPIPAPSLREPAIRYSCLKKNTTCKFVTEYIR